MYVKRGMQTRTNAWPTGTVLRNPSNFVFIAPFDNSQALPTPDRFNIADARIARQVNSPIAFEAPYLDRSAARSLMGFQQSTPPNTYDVDTTPEDVLSDQTTTMRQWLGQAASVRHGMGLDTAVWTNGFQAGAPIEDGVQAFYPPGVTARGTTLAGLGDIAAGTGVDPISLAIGAAVGAGLLWMLCRKRR